MNDRERLRYDRASRVRTFGNQNTADFAAGSVAATLLAANDQLVRDVDDAKAAQRRTADTHGARRFAESKSMTGRISPSCGQSF